MPSDTLHEERQAAPARPARRGVGGARQAWVLARRYVSIWWGDRQALGVMLAQGLAVAVLLGMVFGNLEDVARPRDRLDRTVNLLSLLAVTCFWFGCNTAAKELVKERVIFLRERAFNLRVSAYFASKFLVLVLIGLIQASLLFLIVRAWCQPPGSSGLQWATLAALTVAGTAVGLLLSALARSEEVAIALVPIAVIPQIILDGVVAPLTGSARLLAEWSITAYWGLKILQNLLPEADSRLLGLDNEGVTGPGTIVLAQAAVAAAATVFVLCKTRGKVGSR
jgi:hypothetical protein